MSVVIDGRNGRRSAWREDGGEGREVGQVYVMEVSLREQQLLLRLRMLEAGEYQVRVEKGGKGREGLKLWEVNNPYSQIGVDTS
jgi:hypothetical protein